MTSNKIMTTIWIDGMTCVNCENRIERKLSTTVGIESVKVSYSKGNAEVLYDPQIITQEQIEKLIEELDYHVRRQEIEEKKVKNKVDITNLVAALAIIITLVMLAYRFQWFNIFNNFPVAKEGTGYAMLFIIGILTSVHCVAMCGGICISQCAPKKAQDGSVGRFAALRPSILYNLGRVISYTVIGAVVGAIGSVVSFSGPMRGAVQIIAGVFMVIMGLNMLNIFPWLRKFNPRMPKIFARKINAQKRSNSPLYIGLLNGLMPCGPLQAMQLYALSTGNAFTGALSMFLFSIGTVPLMFLFGAISSFLSKKFTSKMMSVSAVLVVVLGVFMFTNGASLSGFILPAVTTSAQTESSTNKNVATVQGGVQTVSSAITSGSYETITVQKGIPVKWTIQAPAGSINGCNGSIVVPKFNISTDLQTGDNFIEFTPTETGTVAFSCWMGMIRSKIYVVDDINDYDTSKIPDNTGNGNDGLPSCCGGGAGAGTYGSSGSGAANLLIPDVPTDKIVVATIKDGEQNVEINYDENGFSPAVVVMQKGLKTNWIINGKASSAGTNVLFPLYYAQIVIKEGDNKISLIPDQDFNFYTQDSKFAGYVKVVDDISKVDKNAIKDEINSLNTKS